MTLQYALTFGLFTAVAVVFAAAAPLVADSPRHGRSSTWRATSPEGTLDLPRHSVARITLEKIRA